MLLAALAISIAFKRRGADWRIVKLYGGETSIELLQRPDSVRAFRLASPGDAGAARSEIHAGPYAALGTPVEMTPALASEVSAILLDARTYDWVRVKRDDFRPQVGLGFVRGAYVLEVALDLATAQIAIYAGGQPLGVEDFDARRARLVEIAKAVFPGDAEISELK